MASIILNSRYAFRATHKKVKMEESCFKRNPENEEQERHRHTEESYIALRSWNRSSSLIVSKKSAFSISAGKNEFRVTVSISFSRYLRLALINTNNSGLRRFWR